MEHLEFYVKHRTHYPAATNEHTEKNLWYNVLITLTVVLIEPLIMYKHYSHVMPFSLGYYLNQVRYAFAVGIPYGVFQFWINWRQIVKRRRGYCWVGKFKVISKRSLLIFCYLTLMPGKSNRLNVSWKLFRQVRVGDFVVIRRDALGKLERVIKVREFTTSLTRSRAITSRSLRP